MATPRVLSGLLQGDRLAVLLEYRTTQRQDSYFVRTTRNTVNAQVTPETRDAVVARDTNTSQYLHGGVYHFKRGVGAEVGLHIAASPEVIAKARYLLSTRLPAAYFFHGVRHRHMRKP